MKALNPALELEGIVLTMADARNNLSRQVEENVRAHYGDRVLRRVIPRNVRLSEAPSHGTPVALYDAHSRGARSYCQLAEELLEHFRILMILQSDPDSASALSLKKEETSAQ